MTAAYSFNNQRGKVQDLPDEDGVGAIVLMSQTSPYRMKEDSTVELISKHFGNAVKELLAQLNGEILPTAYLDDLGLDSLNAIELTSWIAQYFFFDLPLCALLQTPTLRDLAVKVAELIFAEFGQTI
ncbi:hypothetical protein EsH8_VII_000064 [Colletotrichum jinshuiense]